MKYEFNEIFSDVTKYGKKIPSNQYLKNGQYPIIDQGQEKIAGYLNEEDGLFKDVPAIIFGDHTRILKYVDEPCFLGADGVKLLKSKLSGCNDKFLFYALTNVKIPNTGYNRHFKWLKEAQINIPNRKEQDLIVNVLDNIERIISLRRTELDKLDELVKSRFIEMFGDKNFDRLPWEDVFVAKTGKLDANAMVENGKYPFFTCAKEIYRIDNYAFDQEALLLAGNNAVGKYDVKYYNGKFNAYQRTYVLSLKHKWSYELFKFQLEDKLLSLQQQSLGGLTKYLTIKILRGLDFIVPPIELQNEFADFVNSTDKSKTAIQKSLDDLETLKKSLMQQYFA